VVFQVGLGLGLVCSGLGLGIGSTDLVNMTGKYLTQRLSNAAEARWLGVVTDSCKAFFPWTNDVPIVLCLCQNGTCSTQENLPSRIDVLQLSRQHFGCSTFSLMTVCFSQNSDPNAGPTIGGTGSAQNVSTLES